MTSLTTDLDTSIMHIRRVATCTQLCTHCHSREHFKMLQYAIQSWPNVLVDLQQV